MAISNAYGIGNYKVPAKKKLPAYKPTPPLVPSPLNPTYGTVAGSSPMVAVPTAAPILPLPAAPAAAAPLAAAAPAAPIDYASLIAADPRYITGSAQAVEKRKQAVLDFGDATGVPDVDAATATTAKNNPYSVVKQLEKMLASHMYGIGNAANASGAYFSGIRKQGEQNEASAGGQRSFDARRTFQTGLQGVDDSLGSLWNQIYGEIAANPPGIGTPAAAAAAPTVSAPVAAAVTPTTYTGAAMPTGVVAANGSLDALGRALATPPPVLGTAKKKKPVYSSIRGGGL